MNRLGLTVLAGATALGFSTVAMAADLIVEPPLAPVVPLYTWDGAFVGIFAGGAWGSLDDDLGTLGLVDDTFDASGWVLGLDAGYNWSTGNGIVFGVVGDIGWAALSGDGEGLFDDDFDPDTPLVVGTIEAELDWAGSLRGRLGWDGGAWMPYLTAGLAFAHVTANDALFEDDNTHVGWTAGLGVEFMATQDLSVDLLWRWSDYGSADYALTDPTEFSITANTFTAGLHWKF